MTECFCYNVVAFCKESIVSVYKVSYLSLGMLVPNSRD